MGKVSGCYKVVSCLNLLVNRCNPFLPPDRGLVMLIATMACITAWPERRQLSGKPTTNALFYVNFVQGVAAGDKKPPM